MGGIFSHLCNDNKNDYVSKLQVKLRSFTHVEWFTLQQANQEEARILAKRSRKALSIITAEHKHIFFDSLELTRRVNSDLSQCKKCTNVTIINHKDPTAPAILIRQNRSSEDAAGMQLYIIDTTQLDFKEKITIALVDAIYLVNKKTKQFIEEVGAVLTGVVAYCDEERQQHILGFNVGDGDVYALNLNASEHFVAQRLNRRHNCDNMSFIDMQRIKQKEGNIINGRFMGALAMTRSIGDRALLPYGFSNISEICEITVGNRRRTRLVICSDGVGTDAQISGALLASIADLSPSNAEFAEVLLRYAFLAASAEPIDDKSIVVVDAPSQPGQLQFAFIADGHGGSCISMLLRDRLVGCFTEQLLIAGLLESVQIDAIGSSVNMFRSSSSPAMMKSENDASSLTALPSSAGMFSHQNSAPTIMQSSPSPTLAGAVIPSSPSFTETAEAVLPRMTMIL